MSVSASSTPLPSTARSGVKADETCWPSEIVSVTIRSLSAKKSDTWMFSVYSIDLVGEGSPPPITAIDFWTAMARSASECSQPAGSYGYGGREKSTPVSAGSDGVQMPPVIEALLQEVSSSPSTGETTGSSTRKSSSGGLGASYNRGMWKV